MTDYLLWTDDSLIITLQNNPVEMKASDEISRFFFEQAILYEHSRLVCLSVRRQLCFLLFGTCISVRLKILERRIFHSMICYLQLLDAKTAILCLLPGNVSN